MRSRSYGLDCLKLVVFVGISDNVTFQFCSVSLCDPHP